MDEMKSYITTDSRGVRRITGTRISLDSVVIPFQQGQSAEEIQRQFPSLTLEQVYGAITYYLSHRADVDEYLRHQRVAWETARAQNQRTPSAVLDRLRNTPTDNAGQVR